MTVSTAGVGAAGSCGCTLLLSGAVVPLWLAMAAFMASVTACRLTAWSPPTMLVSSTAYAGVTPNAVMRQSVSAVVHFLSFKEGHVLPLSG